AVLDVVGGKRMAQRVHRGAGDAGFLEVLLDHVLDGAGGHGGLELGDEEVVAFDLRADGQIRLEGAAGFVVEGDAAFLPSLAVDVDAADKPRVLGNLQGQFDVT